MYSISHILLLLLSCNRICASSFWRICSIDDVASNSVSFFFGSFRIESSFFCMPDLSIWGILNKKYSICIMLSFSFAARFGMSLILVLCLSSPAICLINSLISFDSSTFPIFCAFRPFCSIISEIYQRVSFFLLSIQASPFSISLTLLHLLLALLTANIFFSCSCINVFKVSSRGFIYDWIRSDL